VYGTKETIYAWTLLHKLYNSLEEAMVYSIHLVCLLLRQPAYEEFANRRSGVRFGSAEIYNCLAVFPEIEDSICIGQRRPNDSDEQVLLFVKMKNAHRLDQKLKDAIGVRIRNDLSARHVPSFIFETPEIPMTVNGKKTELPVKKIISGQKIDPSSTIANPASLAWYEQFAHLDSQGSIKSLSRL
jgi:acetoacetyl-CoA synthetase